MFKNINNNIDKKKNYKAFDCIILVALKNVKKGIVKMIVPENEIIPGL